MRTARAFLLLSLLVAGCSGSPSASSSGSSGTPSGTPSGCGWVPAGKIVGLIGEDLHTTSRGTLEALRTKHLEARCRTVAPDHAERYVTIDAQYHAKPFPLPKKACSEGWVYAGTAEKFTPACQETVDGHGRTQLIVRWQPYLMHVTIGRSGHDWGGDPERALAISRIVARRLGAQEAAGDG